MKPLTIEWVEKAEADLLSAGVVFRARKSPNFDLTCFLCQQCAEKYFKALMQEAGFPIRKTHDLLALIAGLHASHPSLSLLEPSARILRAYAVDFRYPGKHADRPRARAALGHAKLIRDSVRRELGLPDTAKPARMAVRRRTKRARPARRRKAT